MLKTIKVKKNLRLDELIKYIFDNGIKDENGCIKYRTKYNGMVTVDMSGQINVYGAHLGNELYTVEVEVEIDYDTIFEEVYRVTQDGKVTSDKNKSIGDCLDWKDYQVQIFAMLEGKLHLIWEAESDV